jgi:hypothetical protein
MTGKEARSLAVFLALMGTFYAVDHWFGPVVSTRLFGIAWAVMSLAMGRGKALPVHVGDREAVVLTGWTKALVIVPFACLGLALAAFADDIVCSDEDNAGEPYCR